MSYEARFNWAQLEAAMPEVVKGLVALGAAIDHSGVDVSLVELLKVRASQLNGCAYCLQFHLNKARHLGVPQAKLDALSAWRDAPIFEEVERVALAWCEALTLMAGQHIADSAYVDLKLYFDNKAVANLTAAIGLINAWNRIAGALRVPPPPTR